MVKIKKCREYLGCRTTRSIKDAMVKLCNEHHREISEVMNYLCRIFIEDVGSIRTKFFQEAKKKDATE